MLYVKFFSFPKLNIFKIFVKIFPFKGIQVKLLQLGKGQLKKCLILQLFMRRIRNNSAPQQPIEVREHSFCQGIKGLKSSLQKDAQPGSELCTQVGAVTWCLAWSSTSRGWPGAPSSHLQADRTWHMPYQSTCASVESVL